MFKSDLGLPSFLKRHLSFIDESKEITCLFDVWKALALKYGNNVILNDDYVKITLTVKEFVEKIQTFAAGMQKLGIKKGTKVAIFSENSARWMVVDQAVLACGAIDAVRGSGAPISELEYIYEHSDSTALVIDDLKILNGLSKCFNKNNPKFILYIGNGDISGYKSLINIPCFTFDDFEEYSKKKRFWRTNINKNNPATIVYSSGTTGRPKGICLSHGNLLSQISAVHPLIKLKTGRSALSVLPIWHMYERTCEYYALSRACIIHYTNLRNFKKDVLKYSPSYLFSVPRIWVSMYDAIMDQIKSKPIFAQIIFNSLLNISKLTKRMKRIINNRCIYRENPSLIEKILLWFLAKILSPVDKFSMKFVYKKIKNALGGKFVKGISGGGALPAYIEDFYEAIGVKIYVGYGLTETSPVLAVRKEDHNKLYTVGPAIANTEIKIVDPETYEEKPQGQKGLVIARGPQIMLGYYKDQAATDAVMLPDGWFKTGDLGWLTTDKNLVISGRLKDIIVLSNGENIETDSLEDACLQIPYISQIVITGQDMPNLTALVVANTDEIARVLHKKPDIDPNTLKDFKSMILNEMNAKIKKRPVFRAFERIQNIYFIKEPFTIENGLMTQSLKIKKNVVLEKYANEIQKMYNTKR